MAKRKTFLQKRKAKKSLKKTKSTRKTLRRKTHRVIRGGNYSVATYAGFKNKDATRVFYPGGSSTWAEYKVDEDSKLDN